MIVKPASTDVTTYFHLRLAADGTDATGLTITNIDLQYVRSGVAPAAKVDATALAATDSAHGDNQAFEIDATDQPGVYRVDWPDAAFAAGVREVVLTVKCATVFTESLRVQLTAPQADVTHWLGTAAATPTVAGVPEVDLTHVAGATTNVSALATNVDAILTDTAEIGAAGAGLTNINLPNQTMDIVGNITGNLSGSVGSVTGAVGSVTATVNADVLSISGDTAAADNLEKEYDGTGYGEVLQRTTIASLSSQTSFTLTAGSADNDAYNGCVIVIEDVSTAAQKAVGVVGDYTGLSKTITLLNDPAVFTMATTDIVTLIADRAVKATVDNRTLDITATGAAGLDWGNVENPTTAVNLSATNIDTDQVVASVAGAVGSVTGNVGGNVTGSVGSVATGGIAAASFAAGAIDAAAIAANAIGASELAADAVTEIQSGLSTLTAAQVQTEAEEALQAYHLDHLIASADPGGVVANSSFLAKMLSKSVTPAFSSYDNTTDSLEAVRDNMGTAQTGDSFARLGAPAGASVSADIADVEGKVDDLETRVGTPSDLGSGATVAGNLVDIEGQTDDIGSAGAGLTALATQASVNTIDDMLDTELPALTTAVADLPTNAELATALGTADDAVLAQVALVKAKTDNLPSDPADQSAVEAAITSATSPLATSAALTTVGSNVTSIKAKTDLLPEGIKTNQALANFSFFMADATDHVTGKTGLAITAERSIDGGVFAACTNSASEIGSGFYKIDLAAADLAGTMVILRFAGSGADATAVTLKTAA